MDDASKMAVSAMFDCEPEPADANAARLKRMADWVAEEAASAADHATTQDEHFRMVDLWANAITTSIRCIVSEANARMSGDQ